VENGPSASAEEKVLEEGPQKCEVEVPQQTNKVLNHEPEVNSSQINAKGQSMTADVEAPPQTGGKFATPRTINIGVMGEEELLKYIHGYVNSIAKIASSTRNVHKELKDTIANTDMLLKQYLKTKKAKPKGKSVISLYIDGQQPAGAC